MRGGCLILVLLISACSSTQFAYNRADWLVQWQIERLLELTDEQQALLEQRLEGLHAWHRRQELPRYHSLVAQLGDVVAEGVTDENYRQLSDQLQAAWLRLLNRSLDEVARLLPLLSDAQVAELLASLSEKNDEFYRKWVVIPEDELIERRRQRVLDSLEQWTGDVTPAQRQRVDAWANTAPDVYTLWHSQRLQRHAAFVEVLAERRSRDLTQALRELAIVDEASLQAWERRRLRDNRTRAESLMVWLGQNLTAQQQTHLLEELDKIAEDIGQLHAQR